MMARGSTKVLTRKGGAGIGADGRPTKQVRSSALRKFLTPNQERVAQMEAANARRRHERKDTDIGRIIIIVMCVDVEDRPSERHNAVAQTKNWCCLDFWDGDHSGSVFLTTTSDA